VIRAFDVALSALALAMLAPLFGLIALAVRLDSPGPAFFRQWRTGKDGRPFLMLKFRTMWNRAPVREASTRIADFESFVYAPAGSRDRRVTRLGTILRATSLDELPQLLNVLRGEMSLVGPRPELIELAAQYPAKYHRRHSVPPGITGLAQVSGRGDLTYGETMAYDLDYVDRRSLARNVAILGRTLRAVVSGRGVR
jgi:lipopolysaccharide/colanic/teichoic acid biosynthesis glycosyltransferase